MSGLENFIEFLGKLEHRWDALKNSENQDQKNLQAEFNELILKTLSAYLDFRNIQVNPQIEQHWEKIKIIISTLRLEDGTNQSINSVLNTDKWNTHFGQWLLSGKLIGSATKLVTYDNKLLYESDEVINARLDSLMKLFEKTTNDDTGQMVLNVFETYRKFLIRDVKFQCKLSSATVEKLINYYMITLCHRKNVEHITSMIKLFPNHRKISFVLRLCRKENAIKNDSTFIKAYEAQIAERYVEHLIQCEFDKPKSEQSIKNYNLFLHQLIAMEEKIGDDNFERIILSASDMNVISDYYYLAATQLRLQMPNKYNLSIKLISIGISHDLSFIQELKYSIKSTSDVLEREYKLAFRRIYLALIVLGCMIKDYALRRLCFQAGNFCELNEVYCSEILRHLPVLETVDQGDNLEPVLLDLRYLLETFQYEIRDRTQLPGMFETYSNACYEKLDYYNYVTSFDDDLKPLEYPGVEKYMKRQLIEEKDHISQTSDLDKCIIEIDEFNSELSNRFKKMRNLYAPLRKQKLPSDEEIDIKIKEILTKNNDFRLSASGDIFYELSSISFEDILSPNSHWDSIRDEYNDLNKDNLIFNYEDIKDENLDLKSIYSSGTVQVNSLYYKGYSTYDIENVMLYTIMEKKMKFIREEFAFLNKNRNIDCDEDEQNQIQACFLYLANKPHPEFARLMRLSSTLRRFDNPIEYNTYFYAFDAMPGRYKYRHKHKPPKPIKQEGTENGELMDVDASNLNLPVTVTEIKKESPSLPIQPPTFRSKAPKIPPAITLHGVQMFNTAAEIQHVFKIIQIEIAALIQKEVFIDLSKISDISSPHYIQCVSEVKSTLPIKIQKIRNGNLNPREIEREIKLPINVSGKLAIVLEFRDEIKYDEYYENPYIASTLNHRIMSNLTIDHLTHNIKCDIDCIIDGLVSKIRCVFQGQKTYRPRKKVQKVEMPEQQHVSVIQQSPKLEIPTPTPTTTVQLMSNNVIIPSSISNIVMNVNSNSVNIPPPDNAMHNGMNYPNIQPQQQQQQPPPLPSSYPYPVNNSNLNVNTIGTPQFNNVPVSQQYSTNVPTQYTPASTCYSQPNEIRPIPEMHQPTPTVIQAPPIFANGTVVTESQPITHFQSPMMQAQPECFVPNTVPVLNDSISPNRVKPKVEILAIEEIPPVKLDVNVPGIKISFSNPCIIPKDEPQEGFEKPSISVVTLEKPIKAEIKTEDELVDFEEEIQTTMLQSTVPKKSIHLSDVRSTPNSLLPQSPPPLHYPVPSINEISKQNTPIGKEMCNKMDQQLNVMPPQPVRHQTAVPQPIGPELTPTKSTVLPVTPPQSIGSIPPPPKSSPQMRPNVIKSPIPMIPKQLPDNEKSPKDDPLKSLKKDLSKNISQMIDTAKRKLEADVIDLTDDFSEPSIDLTNEKNDEKRIKMSKKTHYPDITFIECDTKPNKPFGIFAPSMKDEKFLRESREISQQKLLKRSSLIQQHAERARKCRVHVVDVMKKVDLQCLKKDTSIRLQKIPTIPVVENRSMRPQMKNYDNIAVEMETEEFPDEKYVDDAYDATFTIVCHNSVSYVFNDYQVGDGIANVINRCTKTNDDYTNATNYSYNNKLTKYFKKNYYENAKSNNSTNAINNNLNLLETSTARISTLMKMIVKCEDNLTKPLYSDKNHLNFTKNLKNRKKFIQWMPKECNLKLDFDKKAKSTIFDDDKNHKSLLYQMSCAVMNSIPGMRSLEFFKIPTSPQRSLQIKVVHLKEIKATTASETSDVNDGAGNEPGNNVHHSDGNNTETSSNSTTIHIQKIGQTSISHETETRTLQTSFGSIIKNTYPPATSRVVLNSSDMKTEKFVKLKSDESVQKKISLCGDGNMKGSSNIKIIACSSQQSMSEAPKSINKNQTLINMLTQQVMVPTNSNRHYIITSAAKPAEVKMENVTGTSCTFTTNSTVNNSMRKAVTNVSGQSQLVQILNSPPTNFTMKSLNVLSSANTSANLKPNQVMTVQSTGANNDNLKPELPDSIKQQGVVQFICKTDGKIIHLTPICNNSSGSGIAKKITYKVDTSGAKGPTILHHANQQIILNNQLRKEENPNILTIIQKQSNDCEKKPKNTIVGISQSNNPPSPMGTRSVYEETYAKFIQAPTVGITTSSASDMGLLTITSTPVSQAISISGSTSHTNTFIQKIGKTVIQSSNQILPKFNQAFGKSIFSSATLNDQAKITTQRETIINRSVLNTISPVKVTKNEKNEISFIESENIEKQSTTLQSALQGNNLLYARPIGNGKLIASNNNNVLLTALRSNGSQTKNVRIVTTVGESMSNANRTIMTPMRISVPIQIPQLINSVRPPTPGNFRSQIVIAPAATVVRPQSNIQNSNQTGSKLQSLLMGSQQITSSTTINHQQEPVTEMESNKVKVEQKQKKTVDNSTLEQLREFDMVLEQVLERSSVTPNSVSSPPPDNSNSSSPRKQISECKNKTEVKSSSVSIISNSPSDSPTSSKSASGCSSKVAPKLQEDEHTAQRILDILANYKEQVRNSPDLNNKPAPRRRANPPTNPPAKRKKITPSTSTGNIKNSKQFGSSSDVMTDTMGSEEDSSCGVGSGIASTGSINNSPRGDLDDHTDVSMDNNFYMEDAKREIALSPQSSSSSATTSPAHNKYPTNRRSLVIDSKTVSGSDSISSKNFITNNSQSSASSASSITRTSIAETVEKMSAHNSTTAVLMPGNYILPMNVLKSGQHLAILSSNSGQKIIAVPASQLTSPVNINNSSGTSIILQRYVNQMNESSGLSDKTTSNEMDENKTLSFQHQNSLVIGHNKTQNSSIFMKSLDEDVKPIKQENGHSSTYETTSSNNFVSDKTLITEIIQQQQQLSHNHPQHNFMIKLNEPSDPKSSSSIMFMGDENSNSNKNLEFSSIKTEKLDYNGCIKEEMMDFNNENEITNSPMLNTKMEVDENTSSNHDANDAENSQSRKLPQFPSILSSCLTKQTNSANSMRNTKGFLIDPSSKVLMYNNRKQTSTSSNSIDKEILNQKSFSEECADLGVDEPIASDLFPEADLLFDSGSPKFDQINPNDGNIQIKRELENGEVLLQMNYNNNMSEPWLNFDTEDELVDDSQGESSDDVREIVNSKSSF